MLILNDLCPFQTDLGWMVICGSERGITRLTFGHLTAEAALETAGNWGQDSIDFEWYSETRDLLQRYAAGERVTFKEVPVEYSVTTDFQRNVLDELRRIEYGQSCSYAELAEAAGSPKAARAVGSVMANNRIPLILPCHRIVGSGGHLGGYSAPDGLRMKQRLLAMERSALALLE